MYNIEYKKFGPVTVADVYASRAVSVATDTELSDNVIAFLGENPDSHILLNFSDVEFMSSARLTELLRLNDVFLKQRGSMRICGLSAEMKRVFALTKLDTVFRIEEGGLKGCLKRFIDDVR